MPPKKIVENTERARRKHDAQPIDDSLNCLPECVRAGDGSQHDEYHGRERKKHIECNRLRKRDAPGDDTK